MEVSKLKRKMADNEKYQKELEEREYKQNDEYIQLLEK